MSNGFVIVAADGPTTVYLDENGYWLPVPRDKACVHPPGTIDGWREHFKNARNRCKPSGMYEVIGDDISSESIPFDPSSSADPKQ